MEGRPFRGGLLAAELAWYVAGRFYEAGDGSLAFVHLAGFAVGELFLGPPGEATARLTFAAEPFRARRVPNGALSLGLDGIGDFSLYLQRAPVGDLGRPESFAEGERIATLRRTCVVVRTTVDGMSAGVAPSPLISTNLFSARFVDSVPFELDGRCVDLREIIGAGITQFGTAAVPIVPAPKGYDAVIPFSGSAIALREGR